MRIKDSAWMKEGMSGLLKICIEDWLSQELDYELEGMENANV